jgi:hypothetical protein
MEPTTLAITVVGVIHPGLATTGGIGTVTMVTTITMAIVTTMEEAASTSRSVSSRNPRRFSRFFAAHPTDRRS